jgi:hypothetical protein
MYGWFTLKVSLIALMRKALLISALLVVMLQMLSTPAMAKQESSGGTTTATTQQGSVSPPPANNGGDTTPAGGDSNSANNQSTPPSNSVGLIADPVKDTGDSADTSKSGNTLIHCSPGTGCSKEDLGASNDDGKSSSSDANEDPDASNKGNVLIHCSPVTGCSQEDVSVQKAATASDEAGQLADSGTIHGCPYDYDYDEELDICAPGDGSFAFWPVVFGDKPWPGSAGGYVGLAGGFVQDSLTAAGVGLQLGLGHYVEDALVDFGDGGGPIGWGIQGLGYTLGFAGDAAGVLVEGAGQVVGAVADGVGDVVDDIGSAAEDAWDEVSSWF